MMRNTIVLSMFGIVVGCTPTKRPIAELEHCESDAATADCLSPTMSPEYYVEQAHLYFNTMDTAADRDVGPDYSELVARWEWPPWLRLTGFGRESMIAADILLRLYESTIPIRDCRAFDVHPFGRCRVTFYYAEHDGQPCPIYEEFTFNDAGEITFIEAWSDLPGAAELAEFVEKPDLERAEQFVTSGEYAWNSGMFVFPIRPLLSELDRFEPDLVEACRAAVGAATQDLTFTRLDAAAFEKSPSISIDHAVMERTDRAAVVTADIGWNDVGSWNALWEIGQRDDANNVTAGDVVLRDVENTYVRSEGRLISAVGVRDMVIVETADALFVAPRDRAHEVKDVVGELDRRDRSEPDLHPRVFRPWGDYEGVAAGDRFQVKQISVKPGEKLSLQMHHHRAEHWIVVEGTARVTKGDEEILLTENQSTYIPLGVTHRLENPGEIPLTLIEVQSGSYLGEDDIVRFDDIYGREEES